MAVIWSYQSGLHQEPWVVVSLAPLATCNTSARNSFCLSLCFILFGACLKILVLKMDRGSYIYLHISFDYVKSVLEGYNAAVLAIH